MKQDTRGPGQQDPPRAQGENVMFRTSRAHLFSRGAPDSRGQREKGTQTAIRQVDPPGSRRESGQGGHLPELLSIHRSIEGFGWGGGAENPRGRVSSEAKQGKARSVPEASPLQAMGEKLPGVIWPWRQLRPPGHWVWAKAALTSWGRAW